MAEASAFSNMNFLSGLGDLFIPDAKAADISKPAGPVTLDKEGDKKSFDFWKENEGKSGYDHKIFATTLSEEDLKKNESWLRASKIMYDMEHGAGKWDREVRINAWSEETANRRLAQFGIDHMVGFNYQAWETGKVGWNVKDMKPEQQTALLYMMQAYDHKDWNASTFGRAVWASFTDPLSATITAAGLLLAPVTGGTSLAGAGALQKVGQFAFMQTLKSAVAKTLASGAAQKVASIPVVGPVTSAVAKGVGITAQAAATRLTSNTALGAGVNAFVIGGSYSALDSDIRQRVEIAGKNPLGITQEYSPLRTASDFAIGGTMGLGIGVVGGAVLKPAIEWGSKATAKPLIAFKNSLASRKATSPTSTYGIDLPEFKKPLDKIKFMATRELDPTRLGFWLGMRKWDIPVKAMRVDSTLISRPVIEAADNFMKEGGLRESIRQLNKDILDAVKNGQQYDSLISNFSQNKRNDLIRFRNGITDLRDHVQANYHENTLGNKASTLYHDLLPEQKKALIKYLDDLTDVADDLTKGVNSEFSKQVASTLAANSVEDISNSASGLARANFLAETSYARKERKWPDDGKQVRSQWERALERSLNEGYYSTKYSSNLITYKKLKDENLEHLIQNRLLEHYAKRDSDGNLLFDWTSGKTETDINKFVDLLKDIDDMGYGHEVLRALDSLNRMRQPPTFGTLKFGGKDDKDLIPGYTDLQKSFAKDPRYNTDEKYTELATLAVEISKNQRTAPGRASWWLTTPNLGVFHSTHGFLSRDTRTGRFTAFLATYPWDYAFRWKDAQSIGAPGRIYRDAFTTSWAKKLGQYFLGAYDVSFDKKTDVFGEISKDYMNIKTVWKTDDETNFAIVRRAIIRIGSGGLIDDLNLKRPAHILSGPGYLAFAGTALATAGAAADSNMVQGFGDTVADTMMGITAPALAGAAISGTAGLLGIEDQLLDWGFVDPREINLPRYLKENNNRIYDAVKGTATGPDEKAARALIYDLSSDAKTGQPNERHPLHMDDKSPGFLRAVNTIVDRKITDADEAAKVISDVKAYEKQQADIAEAARQKAEAEKAAKEAADAAAKAAKEAQDAAQKQQQPQTGTGNNNAGSGGAIQHNGNASQLQSQSSGASTSPKSIFQNSVGAPPPVGQSVDNLLSMPGDMLKAAYTFDGNVPREIQDAINVGSHFLSGATSLTGGLLSDLYNERIQGGRWWLGAAGGVAGALMLGAWAKDLPILRTFPSISGLFVFLLAAPLIARFAKGAMDGMARQGGDKSYAPIVTGGVQHAVYTSGQQAPAFSSVSHTGGAAVAKTLWEDPDNKHPFLSKITAVDPDGPGPEKFAVQVHSDKGETYADLNVLKDWEGQGMAPVYISKEALAGMGLKREDFRYEAISHKDANTQEEQPFINLRFLDKAHVFQNIFIGAPEGYVPQPQ